MSTSVFSSGWMILCLLVPLTLVCGAAAFVERICCSNARRTLHETKKKLLGRPLLAVVPSWTEVQDMVGSSYSTPVPTSIDSVLQSQKPTFSTERPTLFRERHGWCPYSERVWLTLELGDIDYDTVRIDNTGGPRPSYFGGQTPQMKWPNGKKQGESMDLVYALDHSHSSLSLESNGDEVRECISKFSSVFPNARPSSRAAFLFQWNGEPLWRSTFEETLQGTNDLLGQTQGPFFCGSSVTAADVAWAPFLERYCYQLPCLHEGLNPNDKESYPHLAKWYEAMDQVPAYACRVKGDASSWRKVLSMAGFGNAGIPPQIGANMDELAKVESQTALSLIDVNLWNQYASTRPYLADSPSAQAALTVIRNRKAIIADALKRSSDSLWSDEGLFSSETDLDEAMRAMAYVLIYQGSSDEAEEMKNIKDVGILASYLDERMCVPRDMGSMSAASIKHLAWELSV